MPKYKVRVSWMLEVETEIEADSPFHLQEKADELNYADFKHAEVTGVGIHVLGNYRDGFEIVPEV